MLEAHKEETKPYTPELQVNFVDSGTNHLAGFAHKLAEKLQGYRTQGFCLPQVRYKNITEGERLLVILSHGTDEDLKTLRLGSSAQGSLVKQLVEQIQKEICTGLREGLPNVQEVSLINFRDRFAERVALAGSDYETDYAGVWTQRILAYIQDYKPTRILISGESPFQALLYHTQTQIEGHQDFNNRVEYKEPFLLVGRIFDFMYNGVVIPTSFTAPLHWTSTSNPAYIEAAPTLIHQQKFHLEALLYGRNLYTVSSNTTWNRVDINTIEAFDEFYLKLIAAPKVAIDLETANLARFANKILTAHFSLDGQTAYNIALGHRETRFTADELLYIQDKIKTYLQDGNTALHVYHNAKFDIGVLMAQLGLTFYNHRVYDTQGGVFCLDENVRTYNTFNSPPYNLRRVAYQYGCSAYDEGEVGKSDRTNMSNLPLSHIFEYASKDVVIPYQVHAFQVAEASRRKYKNWETFVIEQLGAMTLVFVGMENKGILVNKKYLIDLCSNDGIVRKLLDEVLNQFKQSEAAQQVNSILVVRDRVLVALKEKKAALKRSLTRVKNYIKTIQKPQRVLKKLEADVDYMQKVTQTNLINQNIYNQLEGNVVRLYEDINKAINVLLDTIDESIYKLANYNTLLRETRLLTLLDELLPLLALTQGACKEDYDLVKETRSTLDNLQLFRYPVNLETEWVFNVSTLEASQLLYFHILNLKPVAKRKDGGGTTDKDFQEVYQHVPEVAYLATYNKYKKLMSTYIEGMMARLETDADSQIDGRLRADYGYREVLTGRSSSRNPNFQNIVQRGDLSKLIKSQFVAGKGEIYIKNDYNAAEVRQWANLSQDEKLAQTFRAGMIMRRELFLATDNDQREALKARIKGEGDVHRLNYAFFFGKDPKDVTDEERTAVKAVIFGVMYGKSSFTLAQDLKCTEEEAQQLLEKLFSTYKVAGDWIKSTKRYVENILVASSPIGRTRHLAATLHHNEKVRESTERKICNSITQGFSSDMGYAGGRILQQVVYKMFQKSGYNLHLYENNTVHDSVEAITKFEHLPISLYLIEHSFTTLMHRKYTQLFNMKWVIESEMDSEVGCSIGTVRKFDWLNLPTVVEAELEYSQNTLGYEYTAEEKATILSKFKHNYDAIMKVKRYETQKYLDYIKNAQTTDPVYLDSLMLDKIKFTKLRDHLIF